MNILIFFIILLVIVLVHEFGHFFSAKKFGIRVDEFGFGFPPKLFGIKKGETEYTFNLLPLGGFVKIFGENPDAESISGPDSQRSVVNKPKYQQAIVLVAGVLANFLLGWFLIYLGLVFGMPMTKDMQIKNFSKYELQDVKLTITNIIPGLPAEKSGLQAGDNIIKVTSSLENMEILNPDPKELKSFIANGKDKEIEIEYIRNKKEIGVVKIKPIEDKDNKAIIGIAMDEVGILKVPPHIAIFQSTQITIGMIGNVFVGIINLIGQALVGSADMHAISGPVGIVKLVGNAYDYGIIYLLFFTALISINLGVINLFPFPALDGGRLFFLLIETIKGSRIKPSIANMFNGVGFAILIILMLIVTYYDIVKLISN